MRLHFNELESGLDRLEQIVGIGAGVASAGGR
jgi:hypothetical protein